MRVHIATDHAGMELSAHLVEHLTAQGYEMVDHGPAEYDALDDYPGFCINAAEAVAAERAEGKDSLGIVLGGSGNGEQIAANKVQGVRAALAWNLSTAKLAREHNDANVVAVGGRQHSLEEATAIIEAFLAEPFSEDERHVRRIGKIARYEVTGEVVM
ncbi:ribose-5-phosphate isomerase [Micrococcus sp. M4NT]|uniref:ribose-5-phosphate isomerase n=1 Tax=Micrococcus sp. M4NT TaxID=2957501 RepID=UPI0029B579EC|nr:ribose-5-phosphate isomerase [Micrococcus sp. M4NT]MDX2341012.1 ribose-5-phosphate isomerase [Micrococcus sp. M4NT]